MNGSKVYRYNSISTTEEILQSSDVPGKSMEGWRRFRISYHDAESGFSNLEGTLYFPPGLDPFPILKDLEEGLMEINKEPDREFWDMS